ncbi:hypothetical protein DLB95_23875 [Salmonella enterica subsp. diarizonae]|uniref:DUF2635 domain-containing protein n=2 Tax=Salmonella enterica TaxID=28901 RepID=A0A5Y3W8H0_SALDZ|nr:hypothetical protein [Salmonella enterica subsp. diarizonae]EBA4379737.1 DUF2635 domain-containing protein [Salmonella enterica]EBG0124375.1 DUF2635 domain-containing protein [Salmonella enterica subsp. enterica serovar Newport]ECB1988381.1 DUF2635 domain-containing protein [Salmonella enterica subsp. enterica serovar Kisarawe]EED3047380.1 DUF2635 domain-containing protein [Salmonella enterica subsp. enterica serovar Virchow]EHL4535609.1 DUF2635 domain-containing protein [Salmonella enteric
MKTLFIKPAPGCAVRDPDTLEFLQPGGEEKPFTSYWCRRLDDGDVVEFDPNATTAPAKPPKNAVVTAADVEKDA